MREREREREREGEKCLGNGWLHVSLNRSSLENSTQNGFTDPSRRVGPNRASGLFCFYPTCRRSANPVDSGQQRMPRSRERGREREKLINNVGATQQAAQLSLHAASHGRHGDFHATGNQGTVAVLRLDKGSASLALFTPETTGTWCHIDFRTLRSFF